MHPLFLPLGIPYFMLSKIIQFMVYSKVMSLPLGFFSEERKGDIIARMSGDVGEVENSITSSLDMLIKNPILIIFYFGTLIITSWQLTLFTLLVLPGYWHPSIHYCIWRSDPPFFFLQ